MGCCWNAGINASLGGAIPPGDMRAGFTVGDWVVSPQQQLPLAAATGSVLMTGGGIAGSGSLAVAGKLGEQQERAFGDIAGALTVLPEQHDETPFATLDTGEGGAAIVGDPCPFVVFIEEFECPFVMCWGMSGCGMPVYIS